VLIAAPDLLREFASSYLAFGALMVVMMLLRRRSVAGSSRRKLEA
jgi:ABC-type branched-subunit amino acid transport system permease subunit